MMKITSSKPKFKFLLGIALIMLISTEESITYASDSVDVERSIVREEVRPELERLINEEGLLDKAIERGINTYIKKQQALARANKERESSAKAKNVRPVNEKDHIYGNPSAEISLIEYSDFECPFCKRFHPTAKQLVDKSDGQVNWIYRHFPLAFHNPGAQKQAEASECAVKLGGNEAFWRYTDPSMVTGQVFAVIVFAVAAAEVAVGLALVISLYRQRKSVAADEINLMKW